MRKQTFGRVAAVGLGLLLFGRLAMAYEPPVDGHSVLVDPAAAPAPTLVLQSPPSPDSHAARHHGHHGGRRATVPGGYGRPNWKQPYAYGYFGASGHRQPRRHFGHQRAYTQWAWR